MTVATVFKELTCGLLFTPPQLKAGLPIKFPVLHTWACKCFTC